MGPTGHVASPVTQIGLRILDWHGWTIRGTAIATFLMEVLGSLAMACPGVLPRDFWPCLIYWPLGSIIIPAAFHASPEIANSTRSLDCIKTSILVLPISCRLPRRLGVGRAAVRIQRHVLDEVVKILIRYLVGRSAMATVAGAPSNHASPAFG